MIKHYAQDSIYSKDRLYILLKVNLKYPSWTILSFVMTPHIYRCCYTDCIATPIDVGVAILIVLHKQHCLT